MFTSFLSTAHDQCFQNLGSFLTKFDDDDVSTGRFFVTDRPIVVARCCSVTCIKSESLALSLAAACVLSCPPKCASRGCVCVWCVLLLSSLSAGLFRRARCTEEAMGSRWENSPPTPKKKKVWIYSSESGSESSWCLPPTPHYNFLGSVHGEKYGLETER